MKTTGSQPSLLPILGFLVTSLGNASLANAHLVTTGMGPVYDGIGHFLLTPEDLVPVLALALYAGMRGADSGRRAMLLLPLAWFVGGIAGMATGIESSPWITAVSFLVVGGLVAADFYMPSFAVSGLTFALGIVHGYLNGALLKDGPGNIGLLGIMAVVFVVVTLASAVAVSIRMPWARVAVRVAGSWICASGMLMIGWLSTGSR